MFSTYLMYAHRLNILKHAEIINAIAYIKKILVQYAVLCLFFKLKKTFYHSFKTNYLFYQTFLLIFVDYKY